MLASFFLKIPLLYFSMPFLEENRVLCCARSIYIVSTTLPLVSSDAISA